MKKHFSRKIKFFVQITQHSIALKSKNMVKCVFADSEGRQLPQRKTFYHCGTSKYDFHVSGDFQKASIFWKSKWGKSFEIKFSFEVQVYLLRKKKILCSKKMAISVFKIFW